MIQRGIENLSRSQQTDVQHRREDAVPEPVLPFENGIFIIAEQRKPLDEKVLQPLEGGVT